MSKTATVVENCGSIAINKEMSFDQLIEVINALVWALSVEPGAPSSRQRSLAITKLEEARLWANEAKLKETK